MGGATSSVPVVNGRVLSLTIGISENPVSRTSPGTDSPARSIVCLKTAALASLLQTNAPGRPCFRICRQAPQGSHSVDNHNMVNDPF